jgi:hypothetical protein
MSRSNKSGTCGSRKSPPILLPIIHSGWTECTDFQMQRFPTCPHPSSGRAMFDARLNPAFSMSG